MRLQSWMVPIFALSVVIAPVNGFPTLNHLVRMMYASDVPEKRCPYAEHQDDVEKALEKRGSLNVNAPISVSGQYAFQAPNFANGDQRGPCPGLNVLANHGYIPHNGVVTVKWTGFWIIKDIAMLIQRVQMSQVIQAVNQVWGMGLDLATILAAMGTVFVGDADALAPSFSIGGTSSAATSLLDNLGGLLGTPRGLDGSHNIIEADSSNTRDDLYVTGNNYALNMTLFQDWIDMANANGVFTMESTAKRAANRFKESMATNPNFYYGPFTGTIARNAGYIFAQRFFANYSSENPDGLLTQDIVKSIYAVIGNGNNMAYNQGYERMPENWYRMPTDYNLVDLNADILYLASLYPELLSVGGNTGTVNSFVGINLANVTGGLLNGSTLLEDNNLMCLVMEIVKTVSPNLLSSIYATITVPLNIILNVLNIPIANLSCPAFSDLSVNGQPIITALKNQFPGTTLNNSLGL